MYFFGGKYEYGKYNRVEYGIGQILANRVSDMSLFPVLITGIILLVTGIAFSLWGVFSKEDK